MTLGNSDVSEQSSVVLPQGNLSSTDTDTPLKILMLGEMLWNMK